MASKDCCGGKGYQGDKHGKDGRYEGPKPQPQTGGGKPKKPADSGDKKPGK